MLPGHDKLIQMCSPLSVNNQPRTMDNHVEGKIKIHRCLQSWWNHVKHLAKKIAQKNSRDLIYMRSLSNRRVPKQWKSKRQSIINSCEYKFKILTDVLRVLRTEIRFAVLKATLIAIRGTRGSLYQKKTGEDAFMWTTTLYLASDCKDDFWIGP